MHAYITKEAGIGKAFLAKANEAAKITKQLKPVKAAKTPTRDITKSMNRKRRYNKLKPTATDGMKRYSNLMAKSINAKNPSGPQLGMHKI